MQTKHELSLWAMYLQLHQEPLRCVMNTVHYRNFSYTEYPVIQIPNNLSL